MKITGGIIEKGIVVGNAYDKYNSKNPLVNWISRGFEHALDELIDLVKPSSIHEVGCGEGHWVIKLCEHGLAVKGTDYSEKAIELAKINAIARNLSPEMFKVRSIYDLNLKNDAAELIICCEVLEHLERPHQGLQVLQSLALPYLIISVPSEPLWRLLNILRGKYIRDFGNTPGHLQHWSTKGFVSFVAKYFEIIAVRRPTPWTMILCRSLDSKVKL